MLSSAASSSVLSNAHQTPSSTQLLGGSSHEICSRIAADASDLGHTYPHSPSDKPPPCRRVASSPQIHSVQRRSDTKELYIDDNEQYSRNRNVSLPASLQDADYITDYIPSTISHHITDPMNSSYPAPYQPGQTYNQDTGLYPYTSMLSPTSHYGHGPHGPSNVNHLGFIGEHQAQPTPYLGNTLPDDGEYAFDTPPSQPLDLTVNGSSYQQNPITHPIGNFAPPHGVDFHTNVGQQPNYTKQQTQNRDGCNDNDCGGAPNENYSGPPYKA